MAESNVKNLIADVKYSDLHFDGISEKENLEIKEKYEILSALVGSNKSSSDRDETKNVLKQLTCQLAGPLLTNLGKLVPHRPTSMLLVFVGNVLSKCFNSDTVPDIAGQLASALGDKLLRKCVAMSHKFTKCFRYLSGMPNPKGLNDDEKKFYIGQIPADVQLFAGYDELAELYVDIQVMIQSPKPLKMSKLMNKVEIYCRLVTFYELFLLFRLAIENAYGVGTKSILNVIEDQLEKDKQLLSFLYKPSIETIELHLRFDPDKCPLIAQFLDSRKMTSDVENFHDKSVKIISVRYPKSWLSAHDLVVLSCLRCHEGTHGTHTRFLLKKAHFNNVYTLHPSSNEKYTVYNSAWVRMSEKAAQALREWRIVKIESTTKGGDISYLLVLRSSENECMYTDSSGRVYVGKYEKGNTGCLWNLEISN